jgi:hypothetical protein
MQLPLANQGQSKHQNKADDLLGRIKDHKSRQMFLKMSKLRV